MPNSVFVTCAAGRKVPLQAHPKRFYPVFGSTPPACVELTPYVRRALLDCDLVEVSAPADESAASAATTPQPDEQQEGA